MKTRIVPTLMALLATALFFGAFGCTPEIINIDPSASRVGSEVTIQGTSFKDAQGDSTVTFSSQDAGTASSWSKAEIVVAVPTGATTGHVVVTVGGEASEGYSFTVLDEADCESFPGGTFDLMVSGLGSDCLPPKLVKDLETLILDLEEPLGAQDVLIPSTENLESILDILLPLLGEISLDIGLGTEHCWEGSGGGEEPIEIDLNEETNGKIPCVITVVPTVVFTLDPIGTDEVWISLSMEVASIGGDLCPIQVPGCTITLELMGTLDES